VDDPLLDASLIDVPVIMIDACSSYSTQLNTCTIPVGGDMPLTLTGNNTYNTGTHELKRGAMTISVARATVMTSTGFIDVIYASAFTLAPGATLVASGPLPLAIAASETAQIDGRIDLVGPAAGSRTDAICGNQAGDKGSNSTAGAGGGGGGAFQGAGGDGSKGNNGATAEGDGGTKITLPIGLLGGCDGGGGGNGQDDASEAGDGAGAILIAAGTSVTIGAGGVIDAGGGHGRGGGCQNCGGSGGGSGGMIFLESANVTVAGVLAANGGAGGEGSNGRDGEDGQPSATAAKAGTGGDSNGGNGGAGSSSTDLDGADTEDERPEGGGGGGGGAGFITIRGPAPAITGTISPPFVPWP
jgi:hypothetical protein